MKRLTLALRTALESFRKQFPHLSMRAIAAKSRVNRYSLTKLLESSADSVSLDVEDVIHLSRFLAKHADEAGGDTLNFAELQKVVWETFGTALQSKRTIPELYEREVDLHDPDIYFVLVLAACRAPRVRVEKLLGEQGTKVISELIERKLLKETEDGRIRLMIGEDFSNSLYLVLHHAASYMRFFKRHRAGLKRNRGHIYFEGLNNAAFKKIYEIHDQCSRQVLAIISDPKNRGDIPFFSMAFFDSFFEDLFDDLEGDRS